MNTPYMGTFRITKLYGTLPPAGVHYSAGKHSGIDLVGTAKEVRAVKGGTVYRASTDPDGWGKYIVIQQTDGLFAIYCHLNKILTAAGRAVTAGQWIGNEGATGQVTGQHLHFELRKTYGDKYSTIDPAKYLGLKNKVGTAEVSEMQKDIKINLNGKDKTVAAIESDGFNYVRLQDLRDSKIDIGYKDGKPTVTVK